MEMENVYINVIVIVMTKIQDNRLKNVPVDTDNTATMGALQNVVSR
jgi:hypothetical protein